MGSRRIRGKACHMMHKVRKEIMLEEINKRINILKNKRYILGLLHKDNKLLPDEAINSFEQDKFIFTLDSIKVIRRIERMSSTLNYNAILAFNQETFEELKLEKIRCPSLNKFIENKVIPWIIDELVKMKEKCEIILELREPNEQDLKEKKRRQLENETNRKRKEEKTRRYKPSESVKKEYEIFKKENNISNTVKTIITSKAKNEKWEKLRSTNETNFKKNISKMNITISNKGMLIPQLLKKKTSYDEINQIRDMQEILLDIALASRAESFKKVMNQLGTVIEKEGVIGLLKGVSVFDNTRYNRSITKELPFEGYDISLDNKFTMKRDRSKPKHEWGYGLLSDQGSFSGYESSGYETDNWID